MAVRNLTSQEGMMVFEVLAITFAVLFVTGCVLLAMEVGQRSRAQAWAGSVPQGLTAGCWLTTKAKWTGTTA